MKKASINDWLATVSFDPSEKNPHIIIDKSECRNCQHKACTYSCPAERYTVDENGFILFDATGCLECGTCRLICEKLLNSAAGFKWSYPTHSKGVTFRQG